MYNKKTKLSNTRLCCNASDNSIKMGTNYESMKYPTPITKGVVHAPSIFMRKNAKFLIDSSCRIKDFNQTVLNDMKTAFHQGDYSRVLDLALEYDKPHRPVKKTTKNSTKALLYKIGELNNPNSIINTFIEILDADLNRENKTSSMSQNTKTMSAKQLAKMNRGVKEKVKFYYKPKNKPNTSNQKYILDCCEQAIQFLNKDLSYNDRAEAKNLIQKVIKLLKT